MKNWQETEQLFRLASRYVGAGDRCALGTVVAIRGSAYRRPGAKLLVRADGCAWGGVSGGCLEADVREVALGAMESGQPVLRRYETGADQDVVWGLGLGCDGMVEILIQPFPPRADEGFLPRALGLLGGREAFSIATVLPESGLGEPGRAALLDAYGCVLAGTGDRALDERITAAARPGTDGPPTTRRLADTTATVFLEFLEPPPEALICGGGDDAIPMAAAAAQAGFRVAVSDHRPAYLTASRFPTATLIDPEEILPGQARGAFAVVMTHDLERDRRWLGALAEGGAAYIGLLGPRSRREDLLADLPDDVLPRVYGPVGLDIGAEGPEQVALAVVAEMLAVRAGRAPRHLRQREEPIHGSAGAAP